MSGQDVPYYLRPNKHVERQIFLELLSRVIRFIDLTDYLYVSMGGRYLEDLKAIHSNLGIKNLLSIESDSVTFRRQLFNRPFSMFDCREMNSGDFIRQIDAILEGKKVENCIVWLDYANARNRQGQLQEIETITSKFAANDILKVTLNASVKTLGNKDDFENIDDFQKHALGKAKDKLGSYFPSTMPDPQEMTDKGFAAIISHACKTAILKGLAGSSTLLFFPLGQFRYNDGYHSMFTLTGIILSREDENNFAEKSGIADCELYGDWHGISEISVPDLSIKERMEIDLDIHSHTPEEIHKRIPFKFDSDEERSIDVLKRYVTHYKRYPNFVRAVF
jgi:hypothetical protein